MSLLIRPQRTVAKSVVQDLDEEMPQVFLDFAGAALPTKSQLEGIHLSGSKTILANPHSTGPAAYKTTQYMEQAKKLILDHFHAHPGRYAGMNPLPPPLVQNGGTPTSSADFHPGYEIVFTSGATEALRIVAETFPWSNDSGSGPLNCPVCHGTKRNVSRLVYSRNAHTSVLGMRGPVLAARAQFCCKPMNELEHFDSEDETFVSDSCSNQAHQGVVHNLLVLPAECNFGGDKPNVKGIFRNIQALNHQSSCTNLTKTKWWTMLDISKAASTGPIDLCDLNPDFACISFYKIFGEPTGLGVLFIKRSAVQLLVSGSSQLTCGLRQRYFGGGSVDAVLAGVDFAVPRSSPTPLAWLTQGTVHFRGICSLRHGFYQLDRLGGMEAIQQHTTCLAVELVRRFHNLRHGNGTPVIRIYGAWSQQTLDLESKSMPGPTVPFNVLRDDGSFVGYNEVSKLAALHQPPLQLRTGCFCNPGACQVALALTDEEIKTNYQISGHVCGDDIDIIQNKPTGAVRASFGKDSIWEDLDVLVLFIEKTFISQHEGKPQSASRKMIQPTVASLTEIYIFPIKSCAAQRVYRWQMDGNSGRLEFDREFALVDSNGTAMRLQTYPKMSLLRPVIDVASRRMTVSAPGCNDLVVQLDSDQDANHEGRQQQNSSLIQVCGNKCGGKLWGDLDASQWFSSFLGVPCWLARHSKGNYYISPRYGDPPTLGHPPRSTHVAFANEQPLLLISEHSVSALNHILMKQGQEVARTLHFRPNLVIQHAQSLFVASEEEAEPVEDQLTSVLLLDKSISLNVVGKCARCSMVDYDPNSGRKGSTLRALADFRRSKGGQITFGVFLQIPSDAATAGSDVWIEEGDRLICR